MRGHTGAPRARKNLWTEGAMRVDPHDNRGRWIIIGGTLGATFGASAHDISLGLALGIAAGMSIGGIMNRIAHHGR